MDELDQLWVPEVKDWRLNERQYGDLIGKSKLETEGIYGAENVALWASSYDIPPHPMSTDGPYYPKDDRRWVFVVPGYAGAQVAKNLLPTTKTE